jgi:predicted DNA-binding ribbon-helix-helix protein
MAPQRTRRAGPPRKNTPIVKRSIKVAGQPTSLSLEEAFWNSLKEIANSQNTSVHDLVSMIDKKRQVGNLSSAVRLFILDYYRPRLMTGHKQPHGPPMTLGNMRELGMRRLLVSCLNPDCRHEALIDVSDYPDDTEVSSFVRRMRCSKCDGEKAFVRPNWKEQPPTESLTGKQWR